MKTTERMCNLKISVQNLLWRKLSWTALAVPGWCGGERKGGAGQPWTLLLLASDWRPISKKFCHDIHNEHWTEDKVVKSHMWVPSSVGSLHRAHWQLKTQEISFFPQIKKVLIFMIIDFMCFIFLLEEPILGNISSSSEVTNSRRNIPMGCERGNRQWTCGYYIISVEICEMTSIHYQS